MHVEPFDQAGLEEQVATGGIDTVLVVFPDLQGRPVGKRVTASHYLDHVAGHGIEACDYLLAVDVDMEPLPGYAFANWEEGYGDITAMPDVTTLRRIPWLEATALVICDLLDSDGAPVAVSPRAVLRRQIERAAAAGYDVRCGTELEFFLFRENYREAAAKSWKGMTPECDGIEDYQIFQTSREEHVIRRIRNDMLAAGIPVEFSKGEAGRGQHEINITYAPALACADNHMIFKNGVKEIAALSGMSATFMSKWTMDEVGSSCHVHSSIWDAASGAPAMADPAEPSRLSPAGRAWIAGQVATARELAWCFAPYLNSYRRYQPGSWAPTAIVWGIDNRTCGYRVVGRGPAMRIECRIPGADVNPYLTLAATIAGGLHGIDAGLELGAPFAGNAYEAAGIPRIPATLVEALAELEASALARKTFGVDVHDHLVNTARQEWLAANRVVTDWELARNFERI